MTEQEKIKFQRAKGLTLLAGALYEAATNEEDKARLELLLGVAQRLKRVLDEAVTEDDTLPPDIGLTLLLFLELKTDGEPEAEADRKDALAQIEEMERDYLDADD